VTGGKLLPVLYIVTTMYMNNILFFSFRVTVDTQAGVKAHS